MSSSGGGQEYYFILGCNTVYVFRRLPSFRKKFSSETLVYIYLTTKCHIPGDSIFKSAIYKAIHDKCLMK
jgi:hypothetical protein